MGLTSLQVPALGLTSLGNTGGNTGTSQGTWIFIGSNNITLSQSTSANQIHSVYISGPAAVAQTNQTIGAYMSSNTTSSVSSGTLDARSMTFRGMGIASVGYSGGEVVISVPAGGGVVVSNAIQAVGSATGSGTNTSRFAADDHVHAGVFSMGVSDIGNTSGDTSVGPGRIVFAGGNNITLSQATAAGKLMTVTISGPNVAAAPTLSYWDNLPWGDTVSGGIGGVAFTASHKSLWVNAMHGLDQCFPGDLTASTMYLNFSLSGSTATMSTPFTSHFYVGVYTRNASSLSLLNSASASFGNAAAATNNSTSVAGQRFLSFHSSQWSSEPVFRFGSQYWLAWFWSSSSRLNQTGSMLGFFRYSTVQRAGTIGVNATATATSQGWAPFYGIYTATTGGLPASIGSEQLAKITAQGGFVPHVIFHGIMSSF